MRARHIPHATDSISDEWVPPTCALRSTLRRRRGLRICVLLRSVSNGREPPLTLRRTCARTSRRLNDGPRAYRGGSTTALALAATDPHVPGRAEPARAPRGGSTKAVRAYRGGSTTALAATDPHGALARAAASRTRGLSGNASPQPRGSCARTSWRLNEGRARISWQSYDRPRPRCDRPPWCPSQSGGVANAQAVQAMPVPSRAYRGSPTTAVTLAATDLHGARARAAASRTRRLYGRCHPSRTEFAQAPCGGPTTALALAATDPHGERAGCTGDATPATRNLRTHLATAQRWLRHAAYTTPKDPSDVMPENSNF
ncbi:hypothetical protein K438DRAFT_2026632 [Mycena galopus ATCC 62051]|nr:hypothetical protein K438DRAFT_2026632 [Mycena galopus ATCC 62051]